MKERLEIRVTGKVQGVFFRASTRKKALEFGINGYVRNEPDGSVLIIAEGEKEDLDRFSAWCNEGPPGASVTHVTLSHGSLIGISGFEISR